MAHHHVFHANKITTTEMLPFLSFSSHGGGVGQGGLVNASQLSMQACDKNTIHSKTTAPKGTGAYYNGKAVVFILILSVQVTLLTTKEVYWHFSLIK